MGKIVILRIYKYIKRQVMDRQILVLNDYVIFKTDKMEAWITEN